MDEQKVTTPITPELTGGRGEKKWLVGGLAGFAVILMITAAALLLQIRKPTEPLPSPRPSPIIPTVKQVEGEGMCEVSFMIEAPEPPVCYEECNITDDLCITGLECTNISGVYRCVNPNCIEEESCVCEEEELICPDENWVVQCRVCTDTSETDCSSWTDWGQAN